MSRPDPQKAARIAQQLIAARADQLDLMAQARLFQELALGADEFQSRQAAGRTAIQTVPEQLAYDQVKLVYRQTYHPPPPPGVKAHLADFDRPGAECRTHCGRPLDKVHVADSVDDATCRICLAGYDNTAKYDEVWS